MDTQNWTIRVGFPCGAVIEINEQTVEPEKLLRELVLRGSRPDSAWASTQHLPTEIKQELQVALCSGTNVVFPEPDLEGPEERAMRYGQLADELSEENSRLHAAIGHGLVAMGTMIADYCGSEVGEGARDRNAATFMRSILFAYEESS